MHKPLTVTFGLPRVSQNDAFGELLKLALSFLKQPEVHLSPGLVLLQLSVSEVPLAVPLPKVIRHTNVHL